MEHTHSIHESAPKTYAKVLGTLFALTIITVAAASFDFGSMNVVIALAIATVKASLVALFFMHLLHDKPLNAVIFLSGFVFLGIFLMLTFVDTGSREAAAVKPSITRAVPGKPAPYKIETPR